jgi:hypothetical protein
MFPSLTSNGKRARLFPSALSPRLTADHKRSPLSAMVRGAVDAALEFATLGEATAAAPAAGAPGSEHPHRSRLPRSVRTRRDGSVTPRAQVCLAPVHRPAGRP